MHTVLCIPFCSKDVSRETSHVCHAIDYNITVRIMLQDFKSKGNQNVDNFVENVEKSTEKAYRGRLVGIPLRLG